MGRGSKQWDRSRGDQKRGARGTEREEPCRSASALQAVVSSLSPSPCFPVSLFPSSWRGPVSRILSPRSPGGGSHSSGTVVAGGLQQPTRRSRPGQPRAPPYLALLRKGFTVPLPLPEERWALTPPFHPYPLGRSRSGGLFSVALSVGLPLPAVSRLAALWSPDFPLRRSAQRLPGPLHPNCSLPIPCRQWLFANLTGPKR